LYLAIIVEILKVTDITLSGRLKQGNISTGFKDAANGLKYKLTIVKKKYSGGETVKS
jgi:hypothetical protein